MKMETAAKLADACRAAAEKKTLYVYGAYGLPLTEENKQRICLQPETGAAGKNRPGGCGYLWL